MARASEARNKQGTLAQENGPTPERAAKSRFMPGSPARVLTTVQSLLNAGEIEQQAVNAAERWYRDWIFAYEGIVEFRPDHQADTTTRHDEISWRMTRAHAAGRLADVRGALGLCAEIRLKAMLVDEKSFSKMGVVLYPRVSVDLARRKVAAQCVLVLEQLSEFYRAQHRKAKPVADQKNCS